MTFPKRKTRITMIRVYNKKYHKRRENNEKIVTRDRSLKN